MTNACEAVNSPDEDEDFRLQPPARKRVYETPAQKKFRLEIDEWSRTCPTYADQMFWRETERAEGVSFMGGENDFDEGRRQRFAQMILERDRRWVTVMPMKARAAWREAYLQRKEQAE